MAHQLSHNVPPTSFIKSTIVEPSSNNHCNNWARQDRKNRRNKRRKCHGTHAATERRASYSSVRLLSAPLRGLFQAFPQG